MNFLTNIKNLVWIVIGAIVIWFIYQKMKGPNKPLLSATKQDNQLSNVNCIRGDITTAQDAICTPLGPNVCGKGSTYTGNPLVKGVGSSSVIPCCVHGVKVDSAIPLPPPITTLITSSGPTLLNTPKTCQIASQCSPGLPQVGEFASNPCLWNTAYIGTGSCVGKEYLWKSKDGLLQFIADSNGKRVA